MSISVKVLSNLTVTKGSLGRRKLEIEPKPTLNGGRSAGRRSKEKEEENETFLFQCARQTRIGGRTREGERRGGPGKSSTSFSSDITLLHPIQGSNDNIRKIDQ